MSRPISLLLTSTLVVALYSVPGFAHDPKEHEAESTTPDCAAMKNMDASKMDKNDPIVKAMLQKCQEVMHDASASADSAHHAEDVSSTDSDTHESH